MMLNWTFWYCNVMSMWSARFYSTCNVYVNVLNNKCIFMSVSVCRILGDNTRHILHIPAQIWIPTGFGPKNITSAHSQAMNRKFSGVEYKTLLYMVSLNFFSRAARLSRLQANMRNFFSFALDINTFANFFLFLCRTRQDMPDGLSNYLAVCDIHVTFKNDIFRSKKVWNSIFQWKFNF